LLSNGYNFDRKPGNGLMNDAWLGQTVEPPQTGQTSPAISEIGAENSISLWEESRADVFSWQALCPWETAAY
jgi:hypothetical protein